MHGTVGIEPIEGALPRHAVEAQRTSPETAGRIDRPVVHSRPAIRTFHFDEWRLAAGFRVNPQEAAAAGRNPVAACRQPDRANGNAHPEPAMAAGRRVEDVDALPGDVDKDEFLPAIVPDGPFAQRRAGITGQDNVA